MHSISDGWVKCPLFKFIGNLLLFLLSWYIIHSSCHFPPEFDSLVCITLWCNFLFQHFHTCLYSTKFSSLWFTICFHLLIIFHGIPRLCSSSVTKTKGFNQFKPNCPAFERSLYYLYCFKVFFAFPPHLWLLHGVSHHMAKTIIY